MEPLLLWALAYVVPATAYCVLMERETRATVRAAAGPLALGLSSLASYGFLLWQGTPFPFVFRPVSVLLLIASAIILSGRYRARGTKYLLSAALQELTMVLAIFLLLTSYPPLLVWFLIVPLFLAVHVQVAKQSVREHAIVVLGGTVSFALFVWQQDWLLNIAVHALVGVLLMRRGLLRGELCDAVHPWVCAPRPHAP